MAKLGYPHHTRRKAMPADLRSAAKFEALKNRQRDSRDLSPDTATERLLMRWLVNAMQGRGRWR